MRFNILISIEYYNYVDLKVLLSKELVAQGQNEILDNNKKSEFINLSNNVETNPLSIIN